jgi:basic salivary proline-rich protein 1/2
MTAPTDGGPGEPSGDDTDPGAGPPPPERPTGPPPQPDLEVTFYPKRVEDRPPSRRLTPSQALRMAETGPDTPADEESRRYLGLPGPGHPPAPPPHVPDPAAPPREPSASEPAQERKEPATHRTPAAEPAPSGGWLRRLARRIFG